MDFKIQDPLCKRWHVTWDNLERRRVMAASLFSSEDLITVLEPRLPMILVGDDFDLQDDEE